MKTKSQEIVAIFLIFLIIISFTNYSLASNFAASIGTKNNTAITSKGTYSTITSTPLINTAANYYATMGFDHVTKPIDPGYTLLVSNLAGRVQLFCTHGSIDSIVFTSNTGLVTGKTRTSGNYEMIGVDDIAKSLWQNNTELVTYLCCNTAGENGNLDIASLAYSTVADGYARAALGFKDEIYYSQTEVWSERYHSKLAEGQSVYDAALYANSALAFLR